MRTTLTAFVPAHKQTNPEHAPGQQVNPVNPLGFVDQTLGDYIRRKEKIHAAFYAVAAEKKKLTFDEWFKQSGWAAWCGDKPYEKAAFPFVALQAAFIAAQENT